MPFPKPFLRLIQQDVAAEGVRAAPMIPGRRDKQRNKIDRQRIVWRDPIRFQPVVRLDLLDQEL
jgi:hypothetical protein